jgi:hypothetical protein
MYLKVLACEIAIRELQYAAARSANLIDLEFLTQGHHDNPGAGRVELQKRIDAVPAWKYDAIVLGYGLCSSILAGLHCDHTKMLVPRAHDCITLFLGSKMRYQQCFSERPATYYFTAGWLECGGRRGNRDSWNLAASPSNAPANLEKTYEEWVSKFGEDQAKYLLEEITRWTDIYSHGCLIDFEFLKALPLAKRVRNICADKGWTYTQIPGDLSLIERMVNGPWPASDFLTLSPGQTIVASFDDRIIRAED